MNLTLILITIIFILLTISTLVLKYKKSKDNKEFKELSDRIRSWWIMSTIFLTLMAAGKGPAVSLLVIISYLAIKEYFTMIPIRRVDRRIIFWAYLSIIPQFWWAYIGWYEMFIIWIPVYIFLLLPFRQVLTGQTNGFLESTGRVHWGLMLFVFSISHLAFLYGLPPIGKVEGVHMLLFLVVLTELNDIYQYIFGKKFGRKKIVPSISPNKTMEGVIGAIFATTITAFLLSFLTPFTILQTLFVALVISLAGFIGDVVVSMIKRDVGIKDSGNIIPGHGGILDRIDSLTYTAPLFFHTVYYLYY